MHAKLADQTTVLVPFRKRHTKANHFPLPVHIGDICTGAVMIAAVIRQRVQAARDIQRKRFSEVDPWNTVCNADMRVGEIRQFCKLDEAGESLIRAAIGQMNLSARGIIAY